MGRGGRSLEGGGELLQTSLEVGGADVAAPQGAMDVLLEEPPVRLQDLCCFLVQRILWVWLLEGGVGGTSVSNQIIMGQISVDVAAMTPGASRRPV